MSNKLQEKTVILDVVFHCPGAFRSESGEKVETQANKRWLSVTKKLFDSKDYDKARCIQNITCEWLRRRAVPCGLEGYFVIPVSMLDEVTEYLNQQDAALREAVEQFCSEYDQIVADAKEQLQDMFDPSRYPSANHYRRGIWMERRFVELGIPDPVKIGDALWEVERNKARQRWQEASDDVVFALREEFAKLVGHLAEKLTPSPDGKTKILRDSALEKTLEWMDLFSKRNVLADSELDELVGKSKDLLNGVDAQGLRRNESARGMLAGAMSQVKAKVDVLLVDKPKRRISFDD